MTVPGIARARYPRGVAGSAGRRKARGGARRWSLGVALLLWGGCVPSGPFEHEALRNEEGGYVVWYRSPPWELWRQSGPTAWLAIAREGASLDDADRGVDPKYVLEVRPVSRPPEASARREVGAARARGEEVVVPPEPYEPEEGPGGWQLLTRSSTEPQRNHRFVFLTRERRGGSLALRFSAFPSLQQPEVDAMIALVEPDVAVSDAGSGP